MKIGYIRVSKYEQHEELQLDAIQRAGCEKWFIDHGVSGSVKDRPALHEALAYCRAGDVLVVWKLDRLGRSLQYLIECIALLQQRDIGFISLTDSIDMTTPVGKLIFHVIGAIAEFERDLIRERTLAGLAAARERGRVGGRPRALQNGKVEIAQCLYDQNTPIKDICNLLGVKRSTLYTYIEARASLAEEEEEE
jgi:DNA invertase Pin-like site-specific DNA recombinase